MKIKKSEIWYWEKLWKFKELKYEIEKKLWKLKRELKYEIEKNCEN